MHAAELHGACIQQQQAARQAAAGADDELERLGGLHAAHDAHQRGQHTHGGALHFFKLGLGVEQAGVAGRFGVARVEDGDLCIQPDGGAADQRDAVAHAGGVDHLARAVVVAAVKYHGDALGQQAIEQGRIGALRDGAHLHLGVEVGHGLRQRGHLGLAHARRGVGNLALQVGQVHRIVVDDGDAPDTAGGQVQRCGCAQAACTQDQHVGGQDALLTFDADVIEQDVARIAQQLFVLHKACTQKESGFR